MTKQIALLVSLAMPMVLAAQEVLVGPLKPADAVLKDTIGQLFMVRELHDGRVIVPGGKRGLLIVNLRAGTADSIPGAPYGVPRELAGDTTLLASSRAGWVFLDGTRVLGMLAPTNPVVMAVRSLLGADSTGHVLTNADGAPQSRADTAVLVDRLSAAGQVITILARDPFPPNGVPFPPYRVQEDAILAIDGWIAVVRIAPYRVDWRTPGGEWIRGSPIPVPIVTIDDREKAAYMLWESQVRGGPLEPVNSATNWPREVPPVRCCAPPLVSPDGKVLVTRTPTADYPGTRYDVVNRQGVLEREIVMGVNEMIVGFGPKDVYITARVSNGHYILSRHPWP